MANLSRIVDNVRKLFYLLTDIEWSIETTPLIAAREPEKVKAAYDLGFRRISMGVQAVSPRFLDDLRREGEPQLCELAVKNMRKAGFEYINIGLMYGFLHQTDVDLDATSRYAIALDPDFITLYRNRYKGTKIENEAGGVSLCKTMRQYRLAYDRLRGGDANIGKNTFSRIAATRGRAIIRRTASSTARHTSGRVLVLSLSAWAILHTTKSASLNEICDAAKLHEPELNRICGETAPKRNTFSNANRTHAHTLPEGRLKMASGLFPAGGNHKTGHLDENRPRGDTADLWDSQ